MLRDGEWKEIQRRDYPVDFLIAHESGEAEPHLHVVKPLAQFNVPSFGEQLIRIPDLLDPSDYVVDTKKRYSAFFGTDLEFLLTRRLEVDTLILAGINTTSCILCTAFEATNRDFRVITASDACDSMDGEEMHRFALRLMAATIGWPLGNAEIIAALAPG